MTNRVIINSSTFKVSQPSVNVNTATPSQLLFDSTTNSYAAILFSGTATVNWNNTSSVSGWSFSGSTFVFDYTASHRWSLVIPFSSQGITQTLSVPPEVLIMVQSTSGGPALTGYSYAERMNNSTAATDWCGGAIWASTTTTALTLRLDKSDYSNNTAVNWNISYIVFQNFSGLPQLTPG